MQRKGNAIRREGQVKNQISIGIDMGGSLWATAVQDWEAGKMSYYGLRDKVDQSKEDRVFDLVSNLRKNGKRIDVFYEAGRYGYWPARKLIGLGANVHILPVNKLQVIMSGKTIKTDKLVNKLQVIMSGKTIKTDKLDAKFLAGLHPSDHVPTVYIPTLEEEGRRDAEREWNRIKESIGRVNAHLIERTPLPGFKSHQTASEWRKAFAKWSKLPEWAECPCLLLLRLPNLLAELEMFEKELATWKQTIQKFQDHDEETSKQNGNTDLTAETVRKLQQFKGVGDRLSRHLPWEIGDFHRFATGKQFAAFFGLTPCPYASGTMKRDQGISKAGRKSLRKMAVECAWLWYRWQKESWLVKKWADRLAQKGRSRRTAIVALARQLMVALWRYVVKGEAIEGAIINKPIAA